MKTQNLILAFILLFLSFSCSEKRDSYREFNYDEGGNRFYLQLEIAPFLEGYTQSKLKGKIQEAVEVNQNQKSGPLAFFNDLSTNEFVKKCLEDKLIEGSPDNFSEPLNVEEFEELYRDYAEGFISTLHSRFVNAGIVHNLYVSQDLMIVLETNNEADKEEVVHILNQQNTVRFNETYRLSEVYQVLVEIDRKLYYEKYDVDTYLGFGGFEGRISTQTGIDQDGNDFVSEDAGIGMVKEPDSICRKNLKRIIRIRSPWS